MRKARYNSRGNARQEKLHMILHVTASLNGVVFEFIPLKYILLSLSVRIILCMPFVGSSIIIISNLLNVHKINGQLESNISLYKDMF